MLKVNADNAVIDLQYRETDHAVKAAIASAPTLTLPLRWLDSANGDADLFLGPFKVGSVYERGDVWHAFGFNYWHHRSHGHTDSQDARDALINGLMALGEAVVEKSDVGDRSGAVLAAAECGHPNAVSVAQGDVPDALVRLKAAKGH